MELGDDALSDPVVPFAARLHRRIRSDLLVDVLGESGHLSELAEELSRLREVEAVDFGLEVCEGRVVSVDAEIAEPDRDVQFGSMRG